MAVEAMAWAFSQQVASGSTAKLVLLGIANHARRDGSGSWPAVSTLATYASCDVRTVQRALKRLRDEGLITETGRGPRGTVEYRLSGMVSADVGVTDCRGDLPREGEADCRGDRLPGRHSGPQGVTTVSPEPSLTVHSSFSLRSKEENVQENDNEHEPDSFAVPKVRWRGRQVPQPTIELAIGILDAFNAAAGTNYRPLDGQGKPSGNLSRILGALDADDRIDLPAASQMIRVAFARRFWQGRPQTGVVFGPGVREGLLEEALNPQPAGHARPKSPSLIAAEDRFSRLRAMHAEAVAEEGGVAS